MHTFEQCVILKWLAALQLSCAGAFKLQGDTEQFKSFQFCEIWSLLRYDAVWFDKTVPVFRWNVGKLLLDYTASHLGQQCHSVLISVSHCKYCEIKTLSFWYAKCDRKNLCEYFHESSSTAAVQPNACNVFDPWDTGIVSSNPTWGACLHFLWSSWPVYKETLQCVDPPFQGVLSTL